MTILNLLDTIWVDGGCLIIKLFSFYLDFLIVVSPILCMRLIKGRLFSTDCDRTLTYVCKYVHVSLICTEVLRVRMLVIYNLHAIVLFESWTIKGRNLDDRWWYYKWKRFSFIHRFISPFSSILFRSRLQNIKI